MKHFRQLWALFNPASEGNAYQTMPREKMFSVSSLFRFKAKRRWALRSN